MKKNVVLLFVYLSFSTTLFAQLGGKVIDNLTISSEILNMERSYAVYLPADYETSERSYPVLYLLHGAGDNHTGWIQFGEIKLIADKAIDEGKSTAMIIVMPDADTGQRGYFNSPKGNWNYEDFFFQELMTTVEETYRIRSEKRYRAIAGLSMGGGGAFMYALHRPDLFSSACPLSAYCGPLNIAELARPWEEQLIDLTNEQKQKYFEQHSVLELIKTIPDEQKKAVRWFIDCGDDDFLYEGNSLVHIAMKKQNIPHEYRVRNGAHNWTYWRESLPEVLGFISQAFHQH